MRLGTLLLRDAVITLGQLESALRAQILGGGRLGTNLVELGHVDVDTLGRYLARVQGAAVASAAELDAADPEAIALLGPERAGRFTAFPLGFGDDGRLQLVLRDPGDAHAIAQLERELGVSIEPRCAAELRLFYYLERHYGIRRPRFLRSSEASPPPAGRERRRSLPPPSTKPIVVDFSRRDQPSAPAAVAPRVDAGQTAERIAQAGDRDAVGDALLDYCVGRFGAAALFIVRARRAIGWKARVGGDALDIEKLSLALDGVSALQTARDGERPYRGPAPTVGRPIERQLWSALGNKGEPEELIAIPIAVRGRVINLLYAHGLGGAKLPDVAVDELRELCAKTGAAYLRLIQAAKATPA